MSIRYLVCALICLASVVLAGVARAQSSGPVVVTHQNGSATIDFSSLDQQLRYTVNGVRIKRCAAPPDNANRRENSAASVGSCDPQDESIISVVDGTAPVITGEGLYLVELLSIRSRLLGRFGRVVVWTQFVPIFYTPDDALIRAIGRHSPQYSFSREPETYPVSIEQLFDRPVSDFSVSRELPNVTVTATNMAQLMRGYGHSRVVATLNRDAALRLPGAAENFPVYWFADRVSESEVRVVYFSLFAFDRKIPAYLGAAAAALADFGSHTLDRESVAISFRRESADRWVPSEVIYAGHLADQRTRFRGCQVIDQCVAAGDTDLASWEGGATRIGWQYASRNGDRPIVYVAHGSHAHAPARGFYRLDVSIVPGLDVTGEPAGDLVDTLGTLRSPRLIQLDLSNPAHAALGFSGSLIKILSGPIRLFPFVRYPTSAWVATLDRDFEDCVRNPDSTCTDYIETLAEQPDPVDPESIDTDGDGVVDSEDAFPGDPQFSVDSDGDGVPDERDAFPQDPSETADLDNDGRGDNAFPVPGLAVITGILSDQSSGAPISGALVRAELIQSAFAREGVVQTRSLPSGLYRIALDLDSLPATFALTVSAPGYVPAPLLLRRSDLDPSGSSERDMELEPASLTVVAIEPEPLLHHLGDGTFEGAINSQFQRQAEGVIFQRFFSLSQQQASSARFEISFIAKGVDAAGSTFVLNEQSIAIPATDNEGSFSTVSFEGDTSQYLQAGSNVFTIAAGFVAQISDYDDFEFVNPVIRFMQ